MTDQVRPAAMTVRDVLRLPDFRRLWLAQAISDVGDGLTLLTLMLLVNQLTGSTLALAGVAMALAIPPLTIGIVAGTYVDRWDRRTIMIVSDSLRAVIVLGFVVVGRAELVPLLLVLAFAQATIGTFFSPARGALIPRVVPADGLARGQRDRSGHPGHRRRDRQRPRRAHRGRGRRHLARVPHRFRDLRRLGAPGAGREPVGG